MPDASPTPTAPAPIYAAATQMIVFEKLHTSALNPRKHFDAAAIEELAASIAAQGLLENLVARPSAKTPGSFEILAGERRYRALKLLIERKTLPTGTAVPVQIRTLDDKAASLLALTENMARSDLTPLEEAEAFAKLEALGVKTDEMAKQTGKTQRFVQLRLALVKKLAPTARKALGDGKITLEHARELVKVPAKRQESVLDRIDDEQLTAEDLRDALREDMVPVERAIFDRKLYKGEIVSIAGDIAEDSADELTTEFFADPDEFAKLQKAAVEAKKAAYKAAGAAFIDEIDWAPADLGELPYQWRKATAAEIAAKKAGVLVVFRPGPFGGGEFGARENVMRKEGDYAAHRGADSTRTTSDKKTDKDEFPLGAAREALVVRTHALQAAVAAEPLHAKRCIVFALLAGNDIVRLMPSRAPVGKPDAGVAKTLEAFAKSGLGDSLHNVSDNAEAKLWGRIVDLPPPMLDKLFANLVAAKISVENPWARDPGASLAEIAMAETMKADVSRALKIDAEFLAKLKKPQLLRVVSDLKLANDVRLAQGPDAVTATVLRKIVLDAGPKLAGYVPPWCKFADAKTIAADLKRTPAIDPAPAKAALDKIAGAQLAKPTGAKPPAAKPAAKPAAPKPTAKKPAAKAKPAVKRGAKK